MLDFSDGCTKSATISEIYPLAPGGVSYASAKGAFGTPAVQVNANNTLPIQTSQFVTRFDQFYVDLALVPTSASTIWQAYDSVAGAVQLSLQLVGAAGTLTLFRGVTSIATGPNYTNLQQYNFEIKTTIDAVAGVCQVYVNGNATPVINFSGNTKSTANLWTDQVRFGPPQNTTGHVIYYSHIAIYDPSGAAPNGLIGQKRIYTLMPVADSATGGLNAFATSPSQTAGNHFNNVKETPSDGDTTYNSDATIADRESYRVAGLPSTVTGIIVANAFAMTRIDAGGAHTSSIICRNGTTDTVATAVSLSATYAYYSAPFALDPNTGSGWTPSGFGVGTTSNAEFGVKVVT